MDASSLLTGITVQPVPTVPVPIPTSPALTGMVVGPVPNSDFLAALSAALEEFSRKSSIAAALPQEDIKAPQGENFSFTASLIDLKAEIKDAADPDAALASLLAGGVVSAPPRESSPADTLIQAIETELRGENTNPQEEVSNPFIIKAEDTKENVKAGAPSAALKNSESADAEEVITAEKYLESYADMLKAAKEVLQWVKMDQIGSEAEDEKEALFDKPVKEASVELGAEEALANLAKESADAPVKRAAVFTSQDTPPTAVAKESGAAVSNMAPREAPEKASLGSETEAVFGEHKRKSEAKDVTAQEAEKPQRSEKPQDIVKPLEAESVKLTRATTDTETPKVKVESPQKVEGEAKSVPAPSPEAKAEGGTKPIPPAPVKIQTEEDAPAKGERLAFAEKAAKAESISQRADTPVKAPALALQGEKDAKSDKRAADTAKAPVKAAAGELEGAAEVKAPVTLSEGEEVAEKRAEPAKKDAPLPKGETGFAAKDASTDSDNFKRGERVERAEARQETATVRTSSDAPKFESALKAPASSNQAERVAEIETAKDVVKIAKLVQQAGQNGETKLTVQLKPEHLGRLVIELTDANGRLDAKIIAQSAESKNFLNSHGQEIVKQLAERGIHIDNMDFAFHDSLTKEQNERSLGQKRTKLPKHLDGGSPLPVEEELKVERDEVYA